MDLSLSTWIIFGLAVNSIIGLVCFEWAWHQLQPVRHGKEEIHEKYFAFRRLDVSKWRKWRFQIGAATVMVPRLIGVLLIVLITAVITKVVTIGVTITEEMALTGWRCKVMSKVTHVASSLTLFCAGMTSRVKQVDYDYSFYLGKDYK